MSGTFFHTQVESSESFTAPVNRARGFGVYGNATRNPAYVVSGDGMLSLYTTELLGSGLSYKPLGVTPHRGGRVSVTARFDPAPGVGFAVMMWPDDNTSWPAGGELDLAELNDARTQSTFTVHWDQTNQQQQFVATGDFTAWHTFDLDWDATSNVIRFSIDGVLIAQLTDPRLMPPAPMHFAVQAGPKNRATAQPGTLAGVHISNITTYYGQQAPAVTAKGPTTRPVPGGAT